MKVFLIRHGQCEANLVEEDMRRRMTREEFNTFMRCSPESLLTSKGEAQAASLARRFAGVPLARLYASPLPRALATATALGKAQGLDPIILPDLRELMPPPLVVRGGPAPAHRLFLSAYVRMLLAPSSEDRLSATLRRARGVWREITAEPAEAIAAVSHGWFLTVLLLSVRFERGWHVVTRDLRNTGVSLVMRRA
jgi:broad specificity phosphatase PhoE